MIQAGGVEGEGPTINSLIFMPDGTGLIRLDSNGTLSPLIPFNHNLTAANGYTIYDRAPFFTNNGTKVDLNSIDFSSQLIIDPSANVTLSAKPKISPSASSDVSSLPPPISQIETIQPPPPATPPIPAPSPTPSPAAPPTSTPSPGALGTPQDPAAIIDRPTAERLAAEDPYFAQFEKVVEMCTIGVLSGTVTMTASQCASSMQQGADRWCGIQYFDALKCELATKMVTEFNKMAGILGNFGLQEIPSFDELAPGQTNPFAPTP